MAAVDESEVSSEQDEELNIFPILPQGLKPDFDISDWIAEVPSSFDGHVRIIYDKEAKGHVAECVSRVSYRKVAMRFPDETKYIGTPLPYIVLHIKNLGRHVAFSLEVQDEEHTTRVLRATTARTTAALEGSVLTLPLKLTAGWNKVAINVAQMIEEAYQVPYKYAVRCTIHANTRVRRIFFCDRIYRDDELPDTLRVFHSGFKSQTRALSSSQNPADSVRSGWTRDDDDDEEEEDDDE